MTSYESRVMILTGPYRYARFAADLFNHLIGADMTFGDQHRSQFIAPYMRIVCEDSRVVHVLVTLPKWSRLGFLPLKVNSHLVILLNSTMPELFREARSILNELEYENPIPFTIVAYRADHVEAWAVEDIRQALHLSENARIIPFSDHMEALWSSLCFEAFSR